METVRQTKLIVDTRKIAQNIREIQKFIDDSVEIMPVIKARGYGSGIGTILNLFKGLDIHILAVAVVDEGIALRSRGFDGQIFVLNPIFYEEIEKALEYDLTLGVCHYGLIKKINEKSNQKPTKIHLEINTGMGRTGISADEVDEYISLIKSCKNINFDGIYTHFSSSDSDFAYTKRQIDIFNCAISRIKNEFDVKYIHACNSAGIINFKEAHYNLVRPGLAIYGYLPDESLKNKINLMPATILKSRIVFVHNEQKGASISYNRSYKTTKNTKVATIPIGYADGIMRNYNGKIVINNQFAKIIGVVNMDNLMVDVTEISDVKIGDDVYIWDNNLIKIEDVAQKCGTISYEILAKIAPRVVKKFI